MTAAPFSILALCGSLRARSLNGAVLRLAAALAPSGMRVEVFDGLGELPLFNPDLEGAPPAPCVRLRAAVAQAHALLIASPEYAHGVTGTMKNALDWLVSVEHVVGKPVAVLNTSPRACHADQALREILRTMSLHIVEAASPVIPLVGAGLDEAGLAASPPVCDAVLAVLRELQAAAKPDWDRTRV